MSGSGSVTDSSLVYESAPEHWACLNHQRQGTCFSLDAVAPKSTHGELQTHLALALAMDSWVEELKVLPRVHPLTRKSLVTSRFSKHFRIALKTFFSLFRPESRQGDPPNLSILIS